MRRRGVVAITTSFLCSSLLVVTPAMALLSDVYTKAVSIADVSTTTGLMKVSVIQNPVVSSQCLIQNCSGDPRNIPALSLQSKFPELGVSTEIYIGDGGGCGIVLGGLRCWGSNNYGQLGDETTTDSLASLVTATEGGVVLSGVSDVMLGRIGTCIVASGALKCVGNSGQTTPSPKNWTTILPSGVLKVVSMEGSLCVIIIDETLWCRSASESYPSPRAGVPYSFTPPPPYDWVDSGVTGVKDFSNGCIAATKSYCSATSGTLDLKDLVLVENAENAEAVWVQPNVTCFYRQGALWCANQRGSAKLPAHLVGVMPKPFLITNMGIDREFSLTNFVLVLPSGILTTLTSTMSCDDCYTSAKNTIARLSVFENATSTAYLDVLSINGVTNSLDFIPMTKSSGIRGTRSAVPITVRTVSGEILAGASVKWSTPDTPGAIASGTDSFVTDINGTASASLATGPISFSIEGATLKSGATLQSSGVRLIVPEEGQVVVTVPDPPLVVDRKVTVQMDDGTPVPSAVITVKNAYLAYSYRFLGTDIATWGAQAKDTRGYFGKTYCTWCFVPPPSYITGADGSITFKTFNTGASSTGYDVDVSYDDGSLVKTQQHSFGTVSDTVRMPNMAKTVASIADADPSTSAVDVEMPTAGTVTIDITANDASANAIEGFSAAVEDVCSGMETGGLWKTGLQMETICRDVSTGLAQPQSVKTKTVQSQSVSRVGSCSPIMTAQTGLDGKLKIVLCPLKSTKYRLRGKGAVATRAFCVVVAKLPCVVGGAPQAVFPIVQAKKAPALTTKKAASLKSIATFAGLAQPKGSTISLRVWSSSSKICRVSGTALKAVKKGTCKATVTVKSRSGTKKSTTISLKVTT